MPWNILLLELSLKFVLKNELWEERGQSFLTRESLGKKFLDSNDDFIVNNTWVNEQILDNDKNKNDFRQSDK